MSVKRSTLGNRAQHPAQAAELAGETEAILQRLESPAPQWQEPLREPLAEAISAVVQLGGTQTQEAKVPLAEAIAAVIHLAQAPPGESGDSLAQAIAAVASIARASEADAKAPLAEAVAAIVHLAETPPEPAPPPASPPAPTVSETPAAPQPSKRKLHGYRLLDIASKIATAIAAISLVLGASQVAEQQKKQAHYQAWQVINSAQGKKGSGGRIEALQNLNKEGVSLAGVNLDKADLAGIDLANASLPGASLQSANLQGANLRGANLQGADIAGANFRAARNLSVEQIKSAKNWQKASYDRKLGTKLGLLPQAKQTPRSQLSPKQRNPK